jgi:hypothetical protein
MFLSERDCIFRRGVRGAGTGGKLQRGINASERPKLRAWSGRGSAVRGTLHSRRIRGWQAGQARKTRMPFDRQDGSTGIWWCIALPSSSASHKKTGFHRGSFLLHPPVRCKPPRVDRTRPRRIGDLRRRTIHRSADFKRIRIHRGA